VVVTMTTTTIRTIHNCHVLFYVVLLYLWFFIWISILFITITVKFMKHCTKFVMSLTHYSGKGSNITLISCSPQFCFSKSLQNGYIIQLSLWEKAPDNAARFGKTWIYFYHLGWSYDEIHRYIMCLEQLCR